ncbi:DUF1904 family protein [Youngiibacter multivorans]|uniref:DUF1904 domain-containing protein n=1 Tax=Youngiibacter multivorans TaxID=937251 RepID=A0ABS4G6U5_9CLOT|nr:DUF1904 family protein [Youngiibacter multivorans]MBP1920249.1 hypothetical protein [Youngiibacter multivorans]
MPILKFNAIRSSDVKTFSKALVDELQMITGSPREYFTLEVISSVYITDGTEAEGPPIVEVGWFDRGQELQDMAAKAITQHVQSAGYPNVDVIFTIFNEASYYENGNHF